MLYEFPFKIPSNTNKNAPLEKKCKLERCVIKTIQIEFPDGCKGLVGVKVLDGKFQLSPKNPDEWCVSDNAFITHPLDYPFITEPLILTLLGYNEDDTYPHKPIIRVAFELPKERVSLEEAIEPILINPSVRI